MSFAKFLSSALVAASAFALVAPACAALVSVNQSAFSGAATVVGFEDLPGNANLVPVGYGAGVGLSLSAGTRSYAHSAYGLPGVAAGLGNMGATWGGGNGVLGAGFSLATAHDLVGFTIGSNVDIQTVISAYRGNTLLGSQTVSVATGQFLFVGFQDMDGINRIVFGDNTRCTGCVHQLDNVTFEQAGSVPEPMTLSLVGLGLLGAALGRRSRQG